MGNESAVAFVAVNDVPAQALRSYYACFGRRVMPDGAIWRLSMASSYLPPNHIGYKVWLSMVAGIDRMLPSIEEWAVALGACIAEMKPRRGKQAHRYVRSYRPDWGRQAALDGVVMALQGSDWVESARSRAEHFGCDRDAYSRIRNFVAGALLVAASQYETELRLVHRDAILS